jgi:hypothetical protein
MCRSDSLRWRAVMLLGMALALSGCGFFGGGSVPATPTAPTAALGSRTITIISPQAGATVVSPILVNGAVSVMPDEDSSLSYRLFGPDSNLLAQGQLSAQGAQGGPGVFSGSIAYSLEQAGAGRIELLELRQSDGAILAISSVAVTLSTAAATPEPPPSEPSPTALPPPPPAAQQQILIDSPPPRTIVGSPVTVAGRTGLAPAGNTLSYVLRDAGGAVLGQGSFPVPTTSAGTGVFNASLTFNLPPNGGNVALEIFEPGAGGAAPVASASLELVVAPPQAILIDSPPPGTQVGSPMTITGRTARYPFQGNLGYRVLDASGRQLGLGTFPVAGAPGGPASFSAALNFSLPPAGGRIVVELVDQNAENNQIAASARLELNIAPQQQAIIIESPTANQQVGSPMTVTGRTVRLPAASQLTYRVRDRAGQQIGTGIFGVSGSQDGGARFNAQVFFSPPQGGGPIALELLELDPASGQVRASTVLNLSVAGPPATATPVPTPTITPTAGPTRQELTIETPRAGTLVGSPVVITGRAALFPQFRELYYVVRTPTRETLGQGSFPVAGQPGQTNVAYGASLTFGEPRQGGPIIVEIYDRDGVGQIIASAIVQLQVSPQGGATAVPPVIVTQQITITAPLTGTLVGSPAILDGRTTLAPYEGQLDYLVSDAAGQELGRGVLEVRAAPEGGFVFSGPVSFNLPPRGGAITVTLRDTNEALNLTLAETSLILTVDPPAYPQPRAP